MNSFIYDVKTKVYFGDIEAKVLAKEIKNYGEHVFMIYGGQHVIDDGIYDLVLEASKIAGFKITEFRKVKPNPRHSDIDEGIKLCKENNCDIVLAIGGGSCLDSAKAIATGAKLNCPIWDVVSKKVKTNGALPLIVIPTMAATGSDMNKTAVISNLEINDKKSIKSEEQRPSVAFLNPKYTYGVSKYQTACGTADILSHILETYFSSDECMYMLDTMMEGLVRTVIKYGKVAIDEPTNYEARANLLWAATWAINDFIRSDKVTAWAMHPIEHELSAYFDITHGLGLAIIMPRYLRYIIDEKSAIRLKNLAVNVYHMDENEDKYVLANRFIDKLEEYLFVDLGISSKLSECGVDEALFEKIASKLVDENGEFKRYRNLNKEDIINILRNCQ